MNYEPYTRSKKKCNRIFYPVVKLLLKESVRGKYLYHIFVGKYLQKCGKSPIIYLCKITEIGDFSSCFRVTDAMECLAGYDV